MAGGFITCLVVGIICVVIGIINASGNINTLHSYHRKRVRPEDVKKMGRAVGTGMLLCGGGTITMGTSLLTFELTANMPLYIALLVVGTLIMVAGLVVSIVSICKYNHGLF